MPKATSDPPRTRLPSYDGLQAAFHRAFQLEIRRMIDGLPLPGDGRVLDAPCGDGFYAALLAKRLSPPGMLTALDLNLTYLKEARDGLKRWRAVTEVVAGDIYQLAFENESFDLVWCGQSLVTLDRPVQALSEFLRVAKPGGRIAVFESDIYHYVMLPWPVGLEMALQTAMFESSRERYGSGVRLAAARVVGRHLRTAGLKDIRRHSVVADRAAPFAEADREFLKLHFDYLRDMVADHLGPDEQKAFDRFTQSGSPECFVESPEAEFTCLNSLYLAKRPG